MTFTAAVRSMRLRTLPLSLSGVTVGALLAVACGYEVSWLTATLLIITTVSLQILSNLSNELGDYLSGTDDADRRGPNYSMQQGELTVQEMRRLITATAVICCTAGAAMVLSMFGTLWGVAPLSLLVLGAAAIWAAIHYTLGHKPYGYHGWGDLFVFIFFGLVATIGGFYVAAAEWPPQLVWLVAAAVGCFSIGVLNINNIRDMASDADTRMTIPLLLGERRAKHYHTLLITSGWLLLLLFLVLTDTVLPRLAWPHYLFLLTLPLYILHLRRVYRDSGRALDPMLPLLVLSTFATMLLLGIGYAVV